MEESSRCSSLASLSPTVSCSNSPGASARRGSGGPTGASPARTAGLPGLEQADRARRRSSREPRPARALPAPPAAPIPLFKPILPQGHGYRAPSARLEWPQSLYSSQIRPGLGSSFLGAASREAADAWIETAQAGAARGSASARARGASRPSGGSSCLRPRMQTLKLAAGEGPRGVASLLRAWSRAYPGFVRR